METKKLKFQKSAQAGAVALNANEEAKMSTTSKVAAAVSGVAAGAAAGYAGYEAYQQYKESNATDDVDTTVEATDTDAVHEAISNLSADAPVVASEPVVVAEPAAPVHHTAPAEHVEPVAPENPDEISDAILAGDFVDPVDAKVDDFPYEVGEIAQVYNVNGELETTAEVTIDGDSMLMVDVNGDGVLDVFRDEFGNEAELGVVSTISDMEMLYAQQHGNDGYLAANDTNGMDDDSFTDDIIDPTTLA